MYFISTASRRPQEGGGSGPCGRGVKNLIFCGRHKWMAPDENYNPILRGDCATFIGTYCSVSSPGGVKANEPVFRHRTVIIISNF